MAKRSSKLKGPAQIAGAVSMRSLDAIFRKPLTGTMPVPEMVFMEHLIGTIAFLPVLFRNWKKTLAIKAKDWAYLIAIGAGGSALGLFCFTEAFKFGNPSVVILLQKTQPIIAVLLAAFLLKEKITKRFVLWAAVILVASFFLAFPDMSIQMQSVEFGAVIFALLAAIFWGSSTVFGRALTQNFDFPHLTALRYTIGLATMFVILMIIGPSETFITMAYANIIPLSLMALITGGVIPLMLYYRGLTETKAKIATFAELAYPVSAVAVNWVVLDATLNSVQLLAGACLVIGVAMMALQEN